MTKRRNHSNHNQNRKHHRNGIKKTKKTKSTEPKKESSGVCAPSIERFPQNVLCPHEMVKCPDKTCRYFKEECPTISECPDDTIMYPGSKVMCPIT
ncbi:60S ribosomal protein L29 [Anaeramoeba flamelloides]|uniref:60S ribosomal protein L29 n=1 Tax=Anaeramoeba flamelloides TaxID=1746091 RepID=A0AAV7ZQC3_9EUKA|nr:60S ribosomal protein L29 [Anaeramoeba flamelloides]